VAKCKLPGFPGIADTLSILSDIGGDQKWKTAAWKLEKAYKTTDVHMLNSTGEYIMC